MTYVLEVFFFDINDDQVTCFPSRCEVLRNKKLPNWQLHFIFSSLEACKKKNNPNLFSCVVFQSIKCFVVIDQLREAVLIDGWNWNTPLEVFVR